MEPLARITPPGSLVAVLLPVIKTHAEEDRAPEYTLDTHSLVNWKEGVQTVGVRTHFYEAVRVFSDVYLFLRWMLTLSPEL